MEYTDSQKQVLNTHGTNLLVSASAGSGKTRVLVDRVINMVLAHESLEHLLIVTFTRAAAKEMKDRIETALHKQISKANAEEQRYLSRQLAVLPVASISTLDAFCQQIVERYYYLIDLDPVFRILGDQAESALLRESVWQDVREQLYQDDTNDAFKRLVMNFSNDRSDDGLTDVVDQVFNFMGSKPDPKAWLQHLADPYAVKGSLMRTPIVQEQLMPLIQAQLQQIATELQAAANLAEQAQVKKASDYITTLMDQLATLDLTSYGWNEFRANVAAFNWPHLPSIGKKADDYEAYMAIKPSYVAHRNNAKKALESIPELMPLPEQETVAAMRDSGDLVRTLAEVVDRFATAYHQEKQRRHVWEFSDIEHFALQILQADSPAAEAVRQQLSKDYHEIMVDEYQDTNELQEAIVTTLAHDDPGNLFMVGDIKQSIYRFRLAEPKLFLDKFNRYRADETAGTEITLAENFRSMKNVDDFTNLIFTQIMDQQLGQISYQGSAKLAYGDIYPDDLDGVATDVASLLIYDTAAPSSRGKNETPSGDAGQVTLVAQKIQQLIRDKTEIWDRKTSKKRPMTYQDIAILSSSKGSNLEIQDQFGRADIPVQINDAQSYFKTTEVQIMMSLLQVIDNPYQDIPLVAVLRSPIVGLNENELAYLRITDKRDDYYTAVQYFIAHYAKYADNSYAEALRPKIQRFLEQLTTFQTVARQQSLATLIWQIYQTTGFLDYVGGMPAGAQRQANLHALYERAADYERNGFKGLFQFVRFIQRMQRNDQDLAEAKTKATTDAVRVMTIHGSKGLEFPVVFLLNASKQFNMRDLNAKAVLNNQLGIGIDYFDQQNRVTAPTLPKIILKAATKKESLAEEMRKLYVALTRAEQRLYIVGACKDQAKKLEAWSAANQESGLVLNPMLREKTTNYLDWIGLALMRHPQFDAADHEVLPALASDETKFDITFYSADDLAEMGPQKNPEAGAQWLANLKRQVETTDYATVDVDQIDQVLNFNYGYQAETQTTAYQSVSEMKRLFEDPDVAQLGRYQPTLTVSQGNRYVTREFAQPAFLQTVTAPTPTEIGTATHLVLQKLDLTQPVTTDAIDQLIDTLVTNQVMTAAVGEKIDRENITRLIDSDFGQQLVAHAQADHRETPFSLLLPAHDVFETVQDETAKILIHGIIDGYFIDDQGEVTLFDYKTDYVADGDAGIEKIKDRYAGQLNLYALALSKMLDRPVAHRYLYLLSLGQLVEI